MTKLTQLTDGDRSAVIKDFDLARQDFPKAFLRIVQAPDDCRFASVQHFLGMLRGGLLAPKLTAWMKKQGVS